MKKRPLLAAVLMLLAVSAVLWAGGASSLPEPFNNGGDEEGGTIDESGAAEFRGFPLGNFITECPQAGLRDRGPQPLNRRQIDTVEQISNHSNNIRLNSDYSCMPQDETSIAFNPTNPKNILGGANDYRLGTGSSGFYASTDGGKTWYDGILPFPSVSTAIFAGGYIPASGDPAVAYDRDGIAYYADLGFLPINDTSGVFVHRSTNGGFTWSRPRVGGDNSQNPPGTCALPPCVTNDPRQPGDGVVQFDADTKPTQIQSNPFNDKEYITTGPRPTGVTPQCFTPAHTPTPCTNQATVGVDRIYVTWTRFNFGVCSPSICGQTSSQINISYSDDQARSWSPAKIINGSAAFCTGSFAGGQACDDNQGSTPTVNPTTGDLWVSFLNGDTPDEDQYLVVRSSDGGNTFSGPFFVSPIFDINYPRASSPTAPGTRPDCAPRNAQRRNTLTNSCFRVASYANMVADKRGGAFADDVYLVLDDNRNGTPASSNVDVFYFKSTDGGQTWIGPTRVNNDRSVAPPNRDCGRAPGSLPSGDVNTPCGGVIDYGNDQWFPWIDITPQGQLNVGFFDRRQDTNSVKHEWPTSRQRPGNYLTWFYGATCNITATDTVTTTTTTIPAGARQCLADQAVINKQPTAPVDPGAVVPGANQTGLPFRNFQISDVPFNLDYAFPRGVFVGDYNNVASIRNDTRNGQNRDRGNDRGDSNRTTVLGFWTDSRNGRSSGGPGGGAVAPSEPGRNPICEQSDVFAGWGNSNNDDEGNGSRAGDLDPFLVTLCPGAAQDKQSTDNHEGGDHH